MSMASTLQSRLLCAVLFIVGIGWAVASELTIPSGYSGSFISPRSFPTLLGIALAILSVIALVESEAKRRKQSADQETDEGGADFGHQLWSVGVTFGFLICYFLALQILGFTLSTIIVVAGFLWQALGQRSPHQNGGMSLALGLGLYLLMGRVLGVYLPTGMLGLGV